MIRFAQLLATVCVMASAACTTAGELPAVPTQAATSTPFSATFTRIAPQGYIDLSLDIDNPVGEPVTIQGRLIARDEDGHELPGVRIRTAFGTEHGRAVVMPGGAVDFVQLGGPGSQAVRDISLEDVVASPVDASPVSRPTGVVPLGANGQEVEYPLDARTARVENPNPVEVRVRVVLLVLRAPQSGVPQEATVVRDVATVDVPGGGHVDVTLDAQARRLLRTLGLTSYVSLRPVLAP